jgi:hypothetical protein
VNWLMHSLRAVVLNGRIVFLEWALREIDPLHPDLPLILVKKRALEAQRSLS